MSRESQSVAQYSGSGLLLKDWGQPQDAKCYIAVRYGAVNGDNEHKDKPNDKAVFLQGGNVSWNHIRMHSNRQNHCVRNKRLEREVSTALTYIIGRSCNYKGYKRGIKSFLWCEFAIDRSFLSCDELGELPSLQGMWANCRHSWKSVWKGHFQFELGRYPDLSHKPSEAYKAFHVCRNQIVLASMVCRPLPHTIWVWGSCSVVEMRKNSFL